MPSWYHGDSTDAPGTSCTLIEVDTWRLSITADGQFLVFQAPNDSGPAVENLRVRLPRQSETPFQGRTGWEITLNYSRAKSQILVNGLLASNAYGSGEGLGVAAEPATAGGLYVGSSVGGANPAQGLIDELETFNAPVGTYWSLGGQAFARQWDSLLRRSQLLTATVPAGLNQIDLAWIRGFEGDITVADNYQIQRRVLGESQWTTFPSGVRTDRYSDVTPTPGQVYEYRVLRQPESQSPTTVAALRAAPVHHRGKVLLLIDTALVADLATEVSQFMWDLRGDGWTVTASVVPRHDDSWTSVPQYKADVATVKSLITTSYNSPPTSDPLVVILLGHVTIPFSGIDSAEDGHYPGHMGAWPADLNEGNGVKHGHLTYEAKAGILPPWRWA